MTANGIELAYLVCDDPPVWVSFEDNLKIINDRFLYGDVFVEPIPDLPENAIVTHRRIPPPSVRPA